MLANNSIQQDSLLFVFYISCFVVPSSYNSLSGAEQAANNRAHFNENDAKVYKAQYIIYWIANAKPC